MSNRTLIAPKPLDTDAIFKKWGYSEMLARRPTMQECADDMGALSVLISDLRGQVEHQKKRQDLKEQQYKIMMIELHNVIQKYS